MEIGPSRPTRQPWGDAATVYEQIGGDDVVRRLSNSFYDHIEADSPKLRAMLPRSTAVSRDKLYEFLSGWMGGPPLYSSRRGHPALGLRHSPFAIDADAAEQWSNCMRAAIADTGIEEPAAAWLAGELDRVALMLINQPD